MRSRFVAPLILAVACQADERERSWILEGHGIAGGLHQRGEDLRIQLQGASWSTGPEPVPAQRAEDDGDTWLYFPVRTAAGAAEAAMELALEEGRATLPLGFRPGEHHFVLSLREGKPEAGSPVTALSALEQAWAGGGFGLWDGETLAGSLTLLPDDRARIQLLTAEAITDGAVPALRRSEGPDLLLIFPVEPQFADESGLLRLNLPTMRAVLPVDREPHPGDRWLHATPGLPSDAALAERLAQVRQRALHDERTLLTRLGPELSAAALALRQEKGACPEPQDLHDDWKLLLGDYRLRVEETAGDCLVKLEPFLVQHTRRTAITASAQGVLHVEVLGAEGSDSGPP
jgi:hypothetical protein